VDSEIAPIARTGITAALRLTILDRMAVPAAVPTVVATGSTPATADPGRALPTLGTAEADDVDKSFDLALVNRT
jgi:hypothetical protein